MYLCAGTELEVLMAVDISQLCTFSLSLSCSTTVCSW